MQADRRTDKQGQKDVDPSGGQNGAKIATPPRRNSFPGTAGLAPLLALTAVRIKIFFREPGAVFWTFGFPLLITVALGIAFRQQGPAVASVVVVAGKANTPDIAALQADPELQVTVLAATEAAARLRTGEVLVVVETAAAASVPADAAPVVVYRFDPSRPEARAVRRHVDDVLQRRAGRADRLATRDETAIARGGRYIDWLIPGLLGMQLLSGALWGTAWSIVTMRQRKLLRRLAGTPMRRRHYLLSYRLAGLLFIPLQVIVLFVFARLTFGVTIHGSWVAVLALSLFGSWSFAGLGLLCASRAENTETANGLINLATLPMFVLSGVFFSSSRFPAFVQPVIQFLPLSAFNEALRHIVNDGASLWSQGPALLVLLGWGVVTFAAAVRLFRWT